MELKGKGRERDSIQSKGIHDSVKALALIPWRIFQNNFSSFSAFTSVSLLGYFLMKKLNSIFRIYRYIVFPVFMSILVEIENNCSLRS